VRVTCVVDGDTFWLRGTKIRIADIDTPEVSQPRCPQERALGQRATERMRQLLNAGRFGLAVPADGRTRDRYGRELRIVTRGGQSLGAVLVREGLAARWGGTRKAWCGA
jgi:endonuclease YncB( thermonuclease family)